MAHVQEPTVTGGVLLLVVVSYVLGVGFGHVECGCMRLNGSLILAKLYRAVELKVRLSKAVVCNHYRLCGSALLCTTTLCCSKVRDIVC